MRTSRQSSLELSGRQNLSTCWSASFKEIPYQFQSSSLPSTYCWIIFIYHMPYAGYCFSSSARELPILSYADDTCLIAKNAKKFQQMLQATEVWLDWADMKCKVSKCRALGLHSRTAQSSRYFNPRLSLGIEEIAFLDSNTISYS